MVLFLLKKKGAVEVSGAIGPLSFSGPSCGFVKLLGRAFYCPSFVYFFLLFNILLPFKSKKKKGTSLIIIK